MGNSESRPLAASPGWTAERRAVNLRLSHEDQTCSSSIMPRVPARSLRISPCRRQAPTTATECGSISRATSRQSPEYLAINPKGRVPALVTDAAS